MAQLGPGQDRSGDIAHELERIVRSVPPTRSKLIEKGMVWRPSHGDTAFTVPLFGECMLRIMPGDDWRAWSLPFSKPPSMEGKRIREELATVLCRHLRSWRDRDGGKHEY